MESAPKDGTPILAWCVEDCGHERCAAHTGHGASLCLYHGHAEGLSATPEGFAIVVWGGGWDDRTYEHPTEGWMPDWWFRHGSEFEEAANPIRWMPLPPAPLQNAQPSEAARAGTRVATGSALGGPKPAPISKGNRDE